MNASIAIVVSSSIITALMSPDVKREAGVGNFVDQHTVASNIVILDDAINQRITDIGNRLAKAAGRPDLAYKFRVVVNPTVNACSTAGGPVYVYTGLLDVAGSEEVLAAVLAHEVAHVAQSHTIKCADSDFTTGLLVSGVLGGLSGGLGAMVGLAIVGPGSSTISQLVVSQAVDAGTRAGELATEAIVISSHKGYAERQENEADRLAIGYLRDAGYDPRAFIRMLKLLKEIRDTAPEAELGKMTIHLLNKTPGVDKRMRLAEEELAKLDAAKADAGGSTK